ncbi:LOW QUALITY PROTEIN: serine-rich adhesin for platelets [Drosophila obscura]|uniref:LOW QUALITY PROTEIN: serine-rich adhesin for platelets n=1 Tax=Drosophila obscura TaxID=7282 RepID=UPI001BB1DEBB|nr:LOW QUALITY PROTEIN: serine-rich adhesin for platelets [Drosophila obscura]
MDPRNSATQKSLPGWKRHWFGSRFARFGYGQGQSQTHSSGEHFEDADTTSSEYTDQQFDLRHTIPGEPGLDYPILSAPPKTSFVCKGRHEGYYADVESRCQAFRICAHTARSPQGFGFLCPNGTLFSQKNFVCDWYRNVNCDDSERYYEMNVENSVGSTHEMMERVRHMMEYPMKTISKALQQSQAHPQTHPQQQQQQQQHQSLSKDLSSASGVLTQPEQTKEPQIAAARGEAIKSEPLNAAGLETISPSASTDDGDGEGIYVNSLGELSSDPGIQFDHTNAHIVAEYPREYHYQKQKNFAERVNSGLELLADTESTSSEVLAPDYMKHIRSNKDEATQVDLVSNINNLLDEVSSDVDPSVSGYQSMAPTKIKQPFRFLSRGFAMHGDGSKGSSSAYVYNKPKQTPGTVRFTPNEIPTEDLKSTEHKHKFGKSTSTSTSPTTTEASPALLIAPEEEAEEVAVEAETTTSAAETTPTTVAVPLNLLEPPLLAPAFAIESLGQAAALTASLPLSDDLAQVEESPEAAEKTSVHQEATKLLLAGVQLTSHDEETQVLNTNEFAESSPAPISTSTSTTSTTSTTPVMLTSTETVTEISSTQERIRGYRRYAQSRGNSSLKRANVRPLPVVRSTTSTTTQRTTTPTRSYLERLAASRLRLSRLSLATRSTTKAPTTTASATTEATTTTTTAASSLSYVRGGAEQGPSKRLSARHIDRETKVETGKASWESVHSNLQRFQVQRGNRIYTPATRSTGSSSSSSTTTSTSATSTSTTSSFPRPTAAGSVNRGKNRYSNFKTQAPVTRTRGPTTARVFTTPRTTSSPALSTLTQQISALASGYGYAQPTLNPPQTQKHIPHAYATQTVSDIAPPSSQSITSSLSPSSGFLSFDKLTRAIVDESVLQNFKSAQSKGSASAPAQSQSQSYRPLAKTSSVGSRTSSGSSSSSRNSIGYNKPATAPAISSLTVPPRPPQLPTPPGIVIVRAEGQRIAPNSASNIIASLATQAPAKASQGSSYVSLNDFFSSKFGQGNENSVAGATTLQQQQQQQAQVQVQRQPAQQQHQQVQQQHHHVQVPQQVQRQQQPQQQLSYITQQYQQPHQQTIYQPNIYHQQQPHSYQQQQQHPFQQQQNSNSQQQSRPSIQSNQQPYLTPNIFVPYQQQQQQLPQFPPLAPPAAVTATGSVQGSFIGGRHVDHLNVQLPTLSNGLIPGLQLAQKRSDVSAQQLQLTNTAGRHPSRSGSGKSRERSFYSGRTSYQVPQSSVGRLPNDITQQLRGRLRRY